MNSQEADRYVEQYPWLSLRSVSGKWCVSNTAQGSQFTGIRETWGRTREEAVENYRDKYDPDPPVNKHPNWDFEQVSQFYKDSAKYRRIVTFFERLGTKKELQSLKDYTWLVNALRHIVDSDLKLPRCDECGQSLDKETT